MNRYTVFKLLFFYLAYMASSYAQPTIQWQNTIGGSSADFFETMSQTSDGGYIIGGSSISDISGDKNENSQGDYDFWVVKLNSTGGIEWQNTLGGSLRELLKSVRQTSDGGYILGGISQSGISGDKADTNRGGDDFWVVKLDPVGVIEWQKTIGGDSLDWLSVIQQTTDGGYIAGGGSYSGISGEKTDSSRGMDDFWVVKLNTVGDIEWQKTIGGNSLDRLHDMQQTSDGGYILGGESYSDSSGEKTEDNLGGNDFWIVKLDSSGNLQWENTIGGTQGDVFTTIQQTDDQGYIMGGGSNSNISVDKSEDNRGVEDMWVVKLDSTGAILWQRTIGGDSFDALNSIGQTNDGGYVVGGYSQSGISGEKLDSNFGWLDFWVIKLNAMGVTQWQMTLGGSSIDDLKAIEQTDDGGYILGGVSTSDISGNKTENSLGSYDYWVVKLNPEPVIQIIENYTPNDHSVKIYPNPVTQHVHFEFESEETKLITVYNIIGQPVYSTESQSLRFTLNMNNMASGLYLYQVQSTSSMEIIGKGKFVKK